MKIYEDISEIPGIPIIAYLGNDVKSQEYVYLDVDYGRSINELNSNNIAFVPTFSFKEEVVRTSFFKPVIHEKFYDINVVPRFIFNQCNVNEKLMNTKDYIELENYSYDNEFMVNKKYINPTYKLDSKAINLNFDNQILDILMDNNCAWLFRNDSILLCFPEDNDARIDLSAVIKRSNALDILYKLKQ